MIRNVQTCIEFYDSADLAYNAAMNPELEFMPTNQDLQPEFPAVVITGKQEHMRDFIAAYYTEFDVADMLEYAVYPAEPAADLTQVPVAIDIDGCILTEKFKQEHPEVFSDIDDLCGLLAPNLNTPLGQAFDRVQLELFSDDRNEAYVDKWDRIGWDN